MKNINEHIKFNIFTFLSTFARSLIEIFISLYLFKNGYSIQMIVLFYFVVNASAIPISYFFVKLSEKTSYIVSMIIGLIDFFIVQILLKYITLSYSYLIMMAILYSIYRRGYWVSRRFYITQIMPSKKTSGIFSILLVMSQIASILAGYVGAIILEKFNVLILDIVSSSLLFLSIIPLATIKYNKEHKEIKLKENLKKYKKDNYLAFAIYELNNLMSFIFPIYIAIYVNNSYSLAGNLNAISNIAIILFVLIYGKFLDKKKNRNYIIISTILVLICTILKFTITNYFILAIYFIEGIVSKMQDQSINKIYFENRNGMDLTHYNLIYQIAECAIRALVTLPLIFINDVRIMIIFVLVIISLLLFSYIINEKIKRKNEIV